MNTNCRETRNDVSIRHREIEDNINDKASDARTENKSPSPSNKDASALSKVLVDHTPQVTPVSLSKRFKPKAR